MSRPDSAQLSAVLGTVAGLTLADVASVCGAICALTGTLYTLWKWRRESKAKLGA
jgi:hypothetical protein